MPPAVDDHQMVDDHGHQGSAPVSSPCKRSAAEWRANKAANQAAGVSEKAYVAQCRGGAAPARTPAAPTTPPPPSAPAAAPSGMAQKTVSACRAEGRANKAANQAAGVSEKAYVAQCRGGAAPARTPRLPRRHQQRRSPQQLRLRLPFRLRPGHPRSAQVNLGQMSSQQSLKPGRAARRIPWCGLTCRPEFTTSAVRGITEKTKKGAYMCERDAAAAGMRASENETHP
jgi:hypothetical protein